MITNITRDMNVNLPRINWHSLFQSKPTKKRRKSIHRRKIRKTRRIRKNPMLVKNKKNLSPQMREGVDFGNLLTTLWRLQKNPDKIYLGDYRIHHGLAGSLLTLAGLYYKDDFFTGLGSTVAYDDINDIDHWFNFEN